MTVQLSEVLRAELPLINDSFGKDGLARAELLEAFQLAGEDLREETFPATAFKGGPEQVELLVHRPGEHSYLYKEKSTAQGPVLTEITLHPATLLNYCEREYKGETFLSEDEASDAIMLVAFALIIEVIAANRVGSPDSPEIQEMAEKVQNILVPIMLRDMGKDET